MKCYYDFHLHTGLSPCADEDMTPNNIVNMALLNEIDCIAITDHNTCGNVKAVMKAAQGSDLLVIPGMELETAEEIHVVCLFSELAQAETFQQYVMQRLPKIKNKPDIFGRQIFFDEEDQETGEYEYLLITATDIGIYQVFDILHQHGGIAIPAHVDRKSYSIISNLGSIPCELPIHLVEFSKRVDPEIYLKDFSHLFPTKVACLQSSDAHCLADMFERNRFLEIDAKNSKQVIEYLKNLHL